MPKPGGDPSSGISLGDVLRLPKRHPACRRREAQPGSCTERENLDGDAKGKGTSGSNREAESTDAPDSGYIAALQSKLALWVKLTPEELRVLRRDSTFERTCRAIGWANSAVIHS